jgi:hypothetical protein
MQHVANFVTLSLTAHLGGSLQAGCSRLAFYRLVGWCCCSITGINTNGHLLLLLLLLPYGTLPRLWQRPFL